MRQTIGFILAILIAAGGYFLGSYFEQQQSADPKARLEAAIADFRNGYDQQALQLLKPLADDGNAKAQYWLADMYEGDFGQDRDMKTAVGLLEKSATQGFLPAEARLGDLYLNGDEILQDFVKAHEWLEKAALAGDSGSQRNLGQIYALGLGVDRDPAEAYAWYETAAVSGDGLAKARRDELLKSMRPDDETKGQKRAEDIATQIKPVSK